MHITSDGSALPRFGPSLPEMATRATAWIRSIEHVRVFCMVALAAAAVLTRVVALDTFGFSEDEIDKVQSAERYRQGDFVGDGEHPALMKLAIAATTAAADGWNRLLPQAPVSPETAVRLPNALAGALIAVLLFLLGQRFFSPLAGVLAAWCWTFDVNAIAANRVAKEDTFVLLFLLLGAWCFECGKHVGRCSTVRAQRWYTAAAAMFGCMLASKYVPFLFGIHVLYFRLADPHPGRNCVNKRRYLSTLFVVFFGINFPVLLPGNWSTIAGFVSEQARVHSGYVFHGWIWANAMSDTPEGLPVWFYLTQFVTKIPLPVLLAIGLGLWPLWRHRRERGPMFVATFIAIMVVTYSMVATKFLRYMLPTLAMFDIVAGVGLAWLAGRVAANKRRFVRAALASVFVVTLIAPLVAWASAQPAPALYRNAIGRALSPEVLWFPPDELYDAGLREAVQRLASSSEPEAQVITDAPAAVVYYARRYGRTDWQIVRPGTGLGSASIPPSAAGTSGWAIVQDGRIYFDNIGMVAGLRRQTPDFVVTVRGFRAVEVYRLR